MYYKLKLHLSSKPNGSGKSIEINFTEHLLLTSECYQEINKVTQGSIFYKIISVVSTKIKLH